MIFFVSKWSKEHKKSLKIAVNEIYKGHNKTAVKILKTVIKDMRPIC